MNDAIDPSLQPPDGQAELRLVVRLQWEDVAALGQEAGRLSAQMQRPVSLDEAVGHRLRSRTHREPCQARGDPAGRTVVRLLAHRTITRRTRTAGDREDHRNRRPRNEPDPDRSHRLGPVRASCRACDDSYGTSLCCRTRPSTRQYEDDSPSLRRRVPHRRAMYLHPTPQADPRRRPDSDLVHADLRPRRPLVTRQRRPTARGPYAVRRAGPQNSPRTHNSHSGRARFARTGP